MQNLFFFLASAFAGLIPLALTVKVQHLQWWSPLTPTVFVLWVAWVAFCYLVFLHRRGL